VAEPVVVSETIEGAVVEQSVRRQRRSAEEKRRIVEATLVPGASIARVAREHGVNANQLFQWRYEYRKQTSVARGEAKAELLPVTLTQTTSLTEAVLRATMRPARVQASSEDFSQKS
jgi:transposase